MKVILSLSALILSLNLYASDPNKDSIAPDTSNELDSAYIITESELKDALVLDYYEVKGDTTTIHKVYEIDENIVIIDSIKIEYERLKPVIKEVEKYAPDPVRKYIGILALIFAVLSVLNAKRKKNKNETKD